ncbi:unnamed protein product [Paramecium octaurelia]|uniref:Transmembrane protein n=1 Tax=Paramecium octaurelia TaxID=43137 RepID=A0A8S1U245_PAROT|nr:unnamed protein product [Paramecium octaurelia]
MIQNSSMNETVSEDEEIQFEFPSNDQGEKINSEEEQLNITERENIQEDFIESDAERKTDVIKTEEFEYYYEYIYEETIANNIAEENLIAQEDSQLDFMDQIIQTDQNQQEQQQPQNESLLNISDSNIKQDSQQSAGDSNENSQDSGQQNAQLNQTMTQNAQEVEEVENLQSQEEENQKFVEEENYYIIVEEEEQEVEVVIHKENEEQSQAIQNEIINNNDEQIIADPIAPEFNRINQSINQEQNYSQTIYSNQTKPSQQYSNQILSLYFDLICYKDQKIIEQEDMTSSSISETYIPTQNINPILLVHTIILTIMLILISITDKQNIKIKKEPIQPTSVSELSELNEYMAMMINGLEQQYNLISQSQEQLAYQLELLEQ